MIEAEAEPMGDRILVLSAADEAEETEKDSEVCIPLADTDACKDSDCISELVNGREAELLITELEPKDIETCTELDSIAADI